MIRLGLCCKFHEAPIAFKTTTVAALSKCGPGARAAKLADLARANAQALCNALEFCAAHGIGCFRVNSQILPVKTHPDTAYDLADLPGGPALVDAFRACGALARSRGIRLAFHPDQFILLSSPDPEINRKSVVDLQYQAEVAEWVGADVINIHAGGAYGDKRAALARLTAALRTLPRAVRARLTLENDDRVYTPADLLPLCRDTGTPFVYDVHHHRCLPDGLSVEDVTQQALATWGRREPLFHVSSPKDGHGSKNPRPHHDFISPGDFPREWRSLDVTVEVEAKAKEVAIARLRQALLRDGVALWPERARHLTPRQARQRSRA
jgi:UV DNA damage endonuclease